MTDSLTTKVGIEARYSIAHAASLIRANPNTVRSWFTGIEFKNRAPQLPVIKLDHPELDPISVSFFNLVEAGFLAAYRAKRVSMQRMRKALDYTQNRLGIERPLLTERFKTDGKDLFLEIDETLLDVSGKPGQRVWPEAVEEYFKSIDFNRFGPTSFWILGRERQCVTDPRIEFGEPIIPRRGIRTSIVYMRFRGGESVSEIASDLTLMTEEVEEAIRCGEDLRLAA